MALWTPSQTDQRQRWHNLKTAEPALGYLERDTRRAAERLIWPGSAMTIDLLFYGRPGGIKRRILPLVGWYARRPELQTSTAYELALTYLWDLLEDHEAFVNGRGQ